MKKKIWVAIEYEIECEAKAENEIIRDTLREIPVEIVGTSTRAGHYKIKRLKNRKVISEAMLKALEGK